MQNPVGGFAEQQRMPYRTFVTFVEGEFFA